MIISLFISLSVKRRNPRRFEKGIVLVTEDGQVLITEDEKYMIDMKTE